ncbi:MAG: hypothetical protein ACREGR_00805 [Minisyncoccia bacterium]
MNSAGWKRRRWLTGPRLAAEITVLALAGACISDFVIASFWERHTMVTAVVSSLLVILVSVSIVEVVLDTRAERRWRLLAQYALFELGDNANAVWRALVNQLGATKDSVTQSEDVHRAFDNPESTAKVRRFLQETLSDEARRQSMLDEVEELLRRNQELITRWGVIMTGSRTYVGLFDRHVEMFTRISYIQYYLRYGTPRGVQYWLSDHDRTEIIFEDAVLSTVHNAVQLEAEAWTTALSVVTRDWWDSRTGSLAGVHGSADRAS